MKTLSIISSYTCRCGALTEVTPEEYGYGWLNGEPLCTRCTKACERATTPRLTLIQRAALAGLDQLHPRFRRVTTRGFDPYSGHTLEFKVCGTEVTITSVIDYQMHIGRKSYNDNDWLLKWIGLPVFHAFRIREEVLECNTPDEYRLASYE